jgi:hypothetical protein
MEQSPSHRANFVEELQGGGCISAMHGTCNAEKPEVAVHLHRGSVGNPPIVGSVSSVPPVAFCRVCGNRRRGPHDLICRNRTGTSPTLPSPATSLPHERAGLTMLPRHHRPVPSRRRLRLPKPLMLALYLTQTLPPSLTTAPDCRR